MKDFFTTKSFKSLIVALVILICAAVISATNNSILSSVINSFTAAMQGVTASAADSVVNKSYDELKKENEELSSQVAQLRTQLVDYYDVKQENARLWKYYDLKRENPTYDLMPASVIRRDPNDNFYSFTVDKGLSSGVSVNDVVVTENGLVGWVYQVDATTSKIKTILSPETKAGAIDKATRDSGVISGNALYCDKNMTTLTKISASNTIKPGDIIVTTGIGGIYPANIIVGEVKELKYDDYDTSLYAVVAPYENIKTVSDVVIITDFTGQGEILTKDQSDKQKTTQPATSAAVTTAPTQNNSSFNEENANATDNQEDSIDNTDEE